MTMEKLFARQNGKKRVEIQRNSFGINLSFMKNGRQSTVAQVTDDMIDMLVDVIDDFKKKDT